MVEEREQGLYCIYSKERMEYKGYTCQLVVLFEIQSVLLHKIAKIT